MPAHRNDAKADAMYELYQRGFSLSRVAIAFGVTRQSVFKMLAKRGLALRQPNTAIPFITWNDCKYTLRPNGYYARSTDDRRYLHRDVWMAAHGPIPCGFQIHHRDGDKTHNALHNLELLSESEHGRRHGFAGNQTVPSIGYRPIRP